MAQEIWFRADIANALRGVVAAHMASAAVAGRTGDYEQGVKDLAVSLAIVFGMDFTPAKTQEIVVRTP